MPRPIQSGTFFINYQQELQVQLASMTASQAFNGLVAPPAGAIPAGIPGVAQVLPQAQLLPQAQAQLLPQAPLTPLPPLGLAADQGGAVIPFQGAGLSAALPQAPAALGLPVSSLPTTASALSADRSSPTGPPVQSFAQQSAFLAQQPQAFVPAASVAGTSSALPAPQSDVFIPFQGSGLGSSLVQAPAALGLPVSSLPTTARNLAFSAAAFPQQSAPSAFSSVPTTSPLQQFALPQGTFAPQSVPAGFPATLTAPPVQQQLTSPVSGLLSQAGNIPSLQNDGSNIVNMLLGVLTTVMMTLLRNAASAVSSA